MHRSSLLLLCRIVMIIAIAAGSYGGCTTILLCEEAGRAILASRILPEYLISSYYLSLHSSKIN